MERGTYLKLTQYHNQLKPQHTMNNFKDITVKFGNMKKEQEFTIYPYDGGDTILIQSDKRIARINLKTGSAILSAQKQGGAYFVHLNSFAGAIVTEYPQDKLIELQGILWNNEGKDGNLGGVLSWENKELFSNTVNQ